MSAPEAELELEVVRIGEELYDLARLALKSDARDVEMYVHRLAYRHRGTPLGQALAGLDKLPGLSLRALSVAPEATAPAEVGYCGCCANECGEDEAWCDRCVLHLLPAAGHHAWERTWFAQHGTDCPFQSAVRLADSLPARPTEEARAQFKADLAKIEAAEHRAAVLAQSTVIGAVRAPEAHQ